MKKIKVRFICTRAFRRGTHSASVDKEALPFYRYQDKWDEDDNESSSRAFYETGG